MSSNETPNRLKEIVNQLITKSQNSSSLNSLNSLSPPKRKSLQIFRKLLVMSDKYVKKNYLRQLAMRIIPGHIEKSIREEVPDQEIKQILYECYLLLKEDFQEIEIAESLNETKLNPEINEKLKLLPKYQELSKLL